MHGFKGEGEVMKIAHPSQFATWRQDKVFWITGRAGSQSEEIYIADQCVDVDSLYGGVQMGEELVILSILEH